VEQAKPATALLQQVLDKTCHKQSEEQEQGGSGQPAPAAPNQYETMPQPKVVVVESEEQRIVGNVSISMPPSTDDAEQLPPPPPGGAVAQTFGGRKPGSTDKKQRKPKTCKMCKENGGEDSTTAATCKGRSAGGTCQHWTVKGKSKKPKKK
jgi:hypothetical protein